MISLSSQSCSACELGASLVSDKDQASLLKDLESWRIDNSGMKKLVKEFKFRDYQDAVKFLNLIADLAQSEDHHPKITLEWGLVTLEWWSHKIKGLHMNDFICAAKSDEMFKSISSTRK